MSVDDRAALNSWERQQEENEQTSRREQILETRDAEINPRRKCLHQFFAFISFITVITAVLMGTAQFLGLYFKKLTLVEYILRMYMLALCSMVVANELEWTSMVRDSRLLRNWITRGLIYAFMGVLGLEQFQASDESRHQDFADFDIVLNFIWIISNIMVGVGALYFVMGILCMQIIYNRLRAEYDRRVEHATDARRAQTYSDVV